MKRPLSGAESAVNDANKRVKQQEESSREAEAVLLDENMLFEILRRVDDGRTLARAACVSSQWRRTAQDERLWELICTRHQNRSPIQMRAVVSALGGFRSLYSSFLWPLLKPPAPAPSSSSSSAAPAVSTWPGMPPAPAPVARPRARWGKDEVNFSISLLSIKSFEKMSFNNPNKRKFN